MNEPMQVLAHAEITHFQQPAYRNIVSLTVSEDLYDDLTDDPSDHAMAQAIESLYSPPYYSSHAPIVNRPFEEAQWFGAIRFPFENWQESRFSQGKFGVWYGASDLNTTIYETLYHWLLRTYIEEGHLPEGRMIERKIYTVKIDALLLDLRKASLKFPALCSKTDYSLTQQIGQVVHKQGHPGLITPSARCRGDVQAIFNSNVLTEPRVNQWLRYTITGNKVRVRDSGNRNVMDIDTKDLM